MGLKDLVREAHGPNKLIPMLEMYIRQRPGDDRPEGWHPSEFCSMCARAEVIRNLVGMIEDWSPDVRLQKIFDVGKALHRWYQEEYFGPMNILWGKWKCWICGKEEWGFMPDASGCTSKAKMHWWGFEEVPFIADSILGQSLKKPIRGHADGLIKVGREWHLLEIKTINDRGFHLLPGARQAHVDQGQVYGYLAQNKFVKAPKEISVPSPTKLTVFYIGKNTSEEKEFTLDLDSDFAESRLSQPGLFEEAFECRKLPDRKKANPKCVNLLKEPAKSCDMASYCFGTMSWGQLSSLKKNGEV